RVGRGGGVAGVGLRQAYAARGSRAPPVSVSGLRDREEPVAGEHVATALAADGVDVRLHVTPTRVDRRADGVVTVTLDDGRVVEGEEILVTTGRRPNTDDLGLDTVGLSGPLRVDETLRVEGTDWLYAVGDVNGRALLTHQGKYQARAAGEAIA